MFDVVGFVVVCAVLCGVVWFDVFASVPLLCVCVLIVICCVVVYGGFRCVRVCVCVC